jgi:RNA polymerase sigma-70 factor (ECF subfamily)
MAPAASHRTASNVREFPRERSSDAELTIAVARGDRQALATIWNRHAQAVRATLFACLGPDHAVDDLLQEVFVGLLRTAATVEDPSRLRSYLLGAAILRARHERRTRGRRARWMTRMEDVVATRVDPGVEGRDGLRALLAILQKLKARDREAFVLRYVQSLPPTEVAEALGVSLATAKRDIARGRERVLAYASDEPALMDYVRHMREASP